MEEFYLQAIRFFRKPRKNSGTPTRLTLNPPLLRFFPSVLHNLCRVNRFTSSIIVFIRAILPPQDFGYSNKPSRLQ
jgi:hypothetical protein